MDLDKRESAVCGAQSPGAEQGFWPGVRGREWSTQGQSQGSSGSPQLLECSELRHGKSLEGVPVWPALSDCGCAGHVHLGAPL